MNDRRLLHASLNDAMRELDRLKNPQALPPATAWSWAQTLTHCAQSIEYSMAGFPAAKPRLFQLSVGAAARLRLAVRTYQGWQGPLRPHFAYGKLSKPEFERAHAMHLANHFSAFDITA